MRSTICRTPADFEIWAPMGGFPAGPPEGGQKIPDLPLRVAARADGDGPGIKAGAELQRHPEFRFPSVRYPRLNLKAESGVPTRASDRHPAG
jgi:hypothetical protein